MATFLERQIESTQQDVEEKGSLVISTAETREQYFQLVKNRNRYLFGKAIRGSDKLVDYWNIALAGQLPGSWRIGLTMKQVLHKVSQEHHVDRQKVVLVVKGVDPQDAQGFSFIENCTIIYTEEIAGSSKSSDAMDDHAALLLEQATGAEIISDDLFRDKRDHATKLSQYELTIFKNGYMYKPMIIDPSVHMVAQQYTTEEIREKFIKDVARTLAA